MTDGSAGISRVTENSTVVVGEDVDVISTRRVMAREDGSELSYAVIFRRLKTSQEGLVNVASIGAVSVSAGNDAGVNTSGVAVPEVNHGVDNWLAGIHVDDLDVQNKFDTFLVFDDVAADEFTSGILFVC